MEEALLYQGGSRHVDYDSLKEMLVDLLDVSLYKKLKLQLEQPKKKDILFDSNEKYWQHILSNGAYIDQYITLSGFYVTEWLPMSPGLFHTEEAARNRDRATQYVARNDFRGRMDGLVRMKTINPMPRSIKHRVPVELDPDGKMNMIQGGVGSLRLEPKELFNQGKMFLFGATSSGVCHEGLPIIVPPNLYSKIIEQIKSDCGIQCNLTGTLQILPTDSLPIEYNREVQKYCLFVEEIDKVKSIHPEDLLISIAITYSPSIQELKYKRWSFVSFQPDNKDLQLLSSVEWLHDYARRYSHVDDPIVVSDFDEFRQHFKKMEFSIKDIANGKFDIIKLMEYKDVLNINFTNVMGDYFNNISNSTIVNKSHVENAFNKVKDSMGEETAIALVKLAEHIEQSGIKEAGESLNDFNEELQKPEPKKSKLKSYWDSLVGAVPTVTAIAGVAEKVVKLFT